MLFPHLVSPTVFTGKIVVKTINITANTDLNEKVLNVYEAQKETGLQNTPEFCKPAQEGKVKNDKKFYTKEILQKALLQN